MLARTHTGFESSANMGLEEFIALKFAERNPSTNRETNKLIKKNFLNL
jgi:hypothetical protein